MNINSPTLGSQLDATYIKQLARSAVPPQPMSIPTRKLASGIVYQDSFQGGAADAGGSTPGGPGVQVWQTEKLTLPDNATYDWDIAAVAEVKGVVIHYSASRDAGVSEDGTIKIAHENGSADFQWQQDILFGGGVGISSLAASISSGNLRLAIAVDNSVTTDVTFRVLYAYLEVG